MKTIQFIKNWALIIAIIVGILSYFIYVNVPLFDPTRPYAMTVVRWVQPMLIFTMLFLTFCKIDARSLRLRRWHLWLLLLQCGLFTTIGVVLIMLPHSGLRVVLEGAMICLICPTATAGAVITRRLGGDVNNITTYTILINLAAALLIPSLVPLVHPNPSMGVVTSALLILGKVFPLLLLPLITALLAKKYLPSLTENLARYQDLSFYLWAIALALALTVTTRSIVHTEVSALTLLWLVVISLICCVMQFYIGRRIGARYGDTVTAGQSLGQKNTVLAIWVGYTFFTPVTAVAGGFYSIWHNVINSYQLYKHRHNVNS